ncbi:BTAD domain-containing putative transcriptional regulator [Psychrobacillus sp. NPDC096623]|uniref:BTAD domain-containing putative transcriptional regulator n=1 Tax=Psychrobacillus sp. NPDC096623 TaxID=3364492 RepID=UPI003829967C
MDQPTIILSKLSAPVPSSTYMRRASLMKKLKTNTHKKLTLLHSGAGYGKSSALAQYFADSRGLYSWYSITEEDDGILPFLRHLISSIQNIVPTFGRSFKTKDLISAYPKGSELQQLYSLFSNELANIDEPLSIVLDDFHLVDHVFHINYIMEKIIEFLPPNIHVVVSTRLRPRWSILLKLKLSGQLVEITESDLMFTEEEILVFFEDYFDKPISIHDATEIMRLTEGWAIAIQLIAMQLAESNRQISQLVNPALNDLFSYLLEEVFLLLSKEDQQSLINFSVFPLFTVTDIQDFFDEKEAKSMERLAGSHAFIQPLGDSNTFRFHSLFQQFLETKSKQKDINAFYETHRRAASYFQEKENIVQAIHHAVKANDERFLAELVTIFAPKMIKAGQFDWLLDLIADQLSKAMRDHFYELYYYEGECHRYKAFYEKARLSYEAALEKAFQNENILYISRANAGLAHIYLDTIQPALAQPYLKEAIEWAEKGKDISPVERVFLQQLMAENLVNIGKANDAKAWIENEQLNPALLTEGNLDARILLRTGKLIEAQQLLEGRTRDVDSLPDSHRETDVLLSFIYSLIGQVSQAKIAANKGIETGIREKSGFVEAVGLIRLGHSEVLTDVFELETPEVYYLQAIQKMDDLNVSRAKAEPYMGLSILKSRQGFFREAIEYGEKGLRETKKVNDYWLSAYILIGLGIVYLENKAYIEAVEHLKQANELFSNCEDVYGEMISHYWLMRIHYVLNDGSTFGEHAKHFMELCAMHNYYFFLLNRTVFGPIDLQSNFPILQKIDKLHPDNKSVQQIISRLNIQNDINYPGYTLYLRLLGPFTLFMGNEEVNDRKWQRDKSKELMMYLYLQNHRYVPKDELIQMLWGESDTKKLDRDFKVTLNSLLKVLEPNRQAREESYFILRKQSMYRLNPNANVGSDLHDFNNIAQKGMEEISPPLSKELLLKAIHLYKGELFENRIAIEWISTERDKAQQLFIQVLERLSQTYTRLKEFEKTIYWAEKLLSYDPTWEEAYRLLMFAYYQLQNRSQSVKWFDRCVEVLEKELNIEPMPTTIQMFEMITGYE